MEPCKAVTRHQAAIEKEEITGLKHFQKQISDVNLSLEGKKKKKKKANPLLQMCVCLWDFGKQFCNHIPLMALQIFLELQK